MADRSNAEKYRRLLGFRETVRKRSRFTISILMLSLGMDRHQANQFCRGLVEAGFAEIVEPGRGRVKQVYRRIR